METYLPTELSGDFDIGYVNQKGFIGYGMHKHKYCELLFVIDSELSFLVEDKIYAHKGSCLIFIRENRLHTTDINSNLNYERYNIYFRQKFISELIPFQLIREVYDNDCIVIPLSDEEKNGLLAYFEQMLLLNKSTAEVEKAILLHLVCIVLLKTANLFKNKFNKEECHLETYIADVINHLNENLTSKLIIEDIARSFFVSRAKLINDFKKSTGTTVGEYILSRRIKLAKSLIKSGHRISDVAEKSGFNNACHFIRTFKKVTGSTPLQYRDRV